MVRARRGLKRHFAIIGAMIAIVLAIAISYNVTHNQIQVPNASTVESYNYTLQAPGLVCVGGSRSTSQINKLVYFSDIRNGTLGPWGSSQGMPLLSSSCAYYNNTIYCVGGAAPDGASSFSTTYYMKVNTSSGLYWNASDLYPYKVKNEGCTAGMGHIYCTGGIAEGENSSGSVFSMVNLTYYAGLSASGIGPWMQSIPYPNNAVQPSCIYYNDTVYCLQGYNNGAPPYGEGATTYRGIYYAHVLLNGSITQWTLTGNYPDINTVIRQYPNETYYNATLGIVLSSCNIYSGYIYCVGGAAGIYSFNLTYYAPIIPGGGVGTFINTTPYPTAVSRTSCIIENGSIYCVGGITNSAILDWVYRANVSSSGISAWSRLNNSLPVPLYGLSCFSTA